MARDDPSDTFRAAAAADGLVLEPRTFDWLGEQGHVGLERVARARRDASIVAPVKAALAALALIYARLGGDLTVLSAARANLLLSVELFHAASCTVIEVDGQHHFTSFRLATLDLYPADTPVGYDRLGYRELCRELAPRMDLVGRGLAAKGFGFGGVPRERAYHDALRDLATPAMGHPAVIRIAAPDGDGAGAYDRDNTRLRELAATPR